MPDSDRRRHPAPANPAPNTPPSGARTPTHRRSLPHPPWDNRFADRDLPAAVLVAVPVPGLRSAEASSQHILRPPDRRGVRIALAPIGQPERPRHTQRPLFRRRVTGSRTHPGAHQPPGIRAARRRVPRGGPAPRPRTPRAELASGSTLGFRAVRTRLQLRSERVQPVPFVPQGVGVLERLVRHSLQLGDPSERMLVPPTELLEPHGCAVGGSPGRDRRGHAELYADRGVDRPRLGQS